MSLNPTPPPLTAWSEKKPRRLLPKEEKKCEILTFFPRVHDFPFYINHYIFIIHWEATFRFLLRPLSEGCFASHFKDFQYGVHNSFSRNYSQKTEKKLSILNNFFFILILLEFINYFIPRLDFFTTIPHSYSVYDIIVLLILHSPSELELFSFLFKND